MAVLTTDEAERLARTLSGDIANVRQTMDVMLRTGENLCAPGVWEGQAANAFRQEWEDTRRWSETSIQQLDELQTTVATINANITEAGGGR